MKKILDFIILLLIISVFGFLLYEKKDTIKFITSKIFKTNPNPELIDNEYVKNINYEFVNQYKNYEITNKDNIKNAIYTYLDHGWDKYTMMCENKYKECQTDVKIIANDNNYLTSISNFTHPYNTFTKFNTSIGSNGIIIFEKIKRYSKEEIDETNKMVDKIYNENYDESKNVRDNIKIFHDYIINHTKYDTKYKKDEINYNSTSSTAYGTLKNGVAICTGYTEAMQLFLEKLNVKNYRISSNTHEWNLVFVEGKWLHLDLTWDDPLVSDGSDTITDKYFLIDTNTLSSFNDGEHDFDKDIYKEANY